MGFPCSFQKGATGEGGRANRGSTAARPTLTRDWGGPQVRDPVPIVSVNPEAYPPQPRAPVHPNRAEQGKRRKERPRGGSGGDVDAGSEGAGKSPFLFERETEHLYPRQLTIQRLAIHPECTLVYINQAVCTFFCLILGLPMPWISVN